MRTTVFSFATARNPQTISRRMNEVFAIRLDPSLQLASHYLSDLPRTDFKNTRKLMLGRAVGFSNEVSLGGMRADYQSLIALHDTLHLEQHRRTLDGVPAVFADLAPEPVDNQNRIRLWDNLVHHLWIDRNEDIVALIRAILVADHFRLHAGPILRAGIPTARADILTVRRAIRARVVLPVGIDNRVAEDGIDDLTDIQARLLRATHRDIIDRHQIGVLAAFHASLDRAAREPEIDTATPPHPGFTGPNVLATAPLRARVAVNALTVSRPLDLPLLAAIEAAPDRSADEALEALSDMLETQQAEIADRDPADDEDEQTFSLLGAEIAVNERIPAGAFIVSAEAVEGGFHLYLTYFHDNNTPELANVTGRINGGASAASVIGTITTGGKPGYQHVRLTEAPISAARFELTLDIEGLTDNSRATLEGLVLTDVGEARGIVPWAGPDDLAIPPPPLFGVNKVGVLDYHRVEQELYCFEAAEPSHIENLMGREHKERMTRSFTLNEVETECTRESGSERQSESQTSDRFEQQKTVEEVLAEENSRNINVNAGVSGGFGKSIQVFANTAVTFANSTSREESRSEALTFARNITSRVAQKITAKSTERRRALVRNEFENVSRQGFDNRAGDEPVVSIYRHLDIVYRNHLVNYGRRCLVEWMIPEPAKNFIRAQELAVPKDDFSKRRPKSPRRIGMRRPSDVSPGNYRKFGKAYGVEDLPPPQPDLMFISRGFSENNPPSAPPEEGETPIDPGPQAVSYEIEIPDDYLATHYKFDHESGGVQVGGGSGTLDFEAFARPISFSVPFTALDPFPMVATVTLRLSIRRVIKRDWQYRIFNIVMEAYREKKAEYDAAKEAFEDEGLRSDLNPRFKKDIIQRELRRIALYMIQKPHGMDVTHNHYAPAQKGKLHRLKLTKKLDRHAARVRFFEQAFEWDLMSYLLYPYFYSDEKSWSVKLAMEDTGNRDFAEFLTSGMARLVVPIRLGFEDAVTHYLQTGEVWFGRGVVLDVDNDLYLSIAEEMADGNEETEILNTWLEQLPTNLIILQIMPVRWLATACPVLMKK